VVRKKTLATVAAWHPVRFYMPYVERTGTIDNSGAEGRGRKAAGLQVGARFCPRLRVRVELIY
jgi:hypothetical protein